jgi:hypothetical protein
VLDDTYFRLLPSGQTTVTAEEDAMLAAILAEDGDLPARPPIRRELLNPCGSFQPPEYVSGSGYCSAGRCLGHSPLPIETLITKAITFSVD